MTISSARGLPKAREISACPGAVRPSPPRNRVEHFSGPWRPAPARLCGDPHQLIASRTRRAGTRPQVHGLSGRHPRIAQRQIASEATLPFTRSAAAIEDIIRENRIGHIAGREAIIRRATAAESASVPSPQMKAPPLVNNQGSGGNSCSLAPCHPRLARQSAAPRDSPSMR